MEPGERTVIWHLYFASKLGLAAQDQLHLQVWLNFPLALLAYWPLPRRRWRLARALLAWPAALALVLHEAGIGLSGRLLLQLGQLSGFSSGYALELGLRLLEVHALPALVVLLLTCLWLNRWLRLDVLLCLALLTLPLANVLQRVVEAGSSEVETRTAAPGGPAMDPQTKVRDFWQGELQRSYPFAPGRQPPFDVVLLHVCSLSWDDLDALGLGGREVFGRFDLVFDQFNSVTSYSGPSMLRLMRANCGQTPHDKLYKPAPDRCGLLQQLHLAGYQVQAYLNHDGQFDGFAEALQGETTVRIQTPVRWPGTPAALKAFDGSPIAGDHAALTAWRASLSASAPPQALYYNTVTLHDGNRVPDAPALDMMDSYRQRLEVLLHDIDRFIGDIERSGRPTLVVLMPEHGAALRKGAQHIAGLRETPWPEITRVPVAVKLMGLDAQRPADLVRPIRVSGPTSYLSFAALLADLMAQPDPWQVLRAAPQALPRVAFVSDNGETLVTLDEQAMWLRTASSGWQHLSRPEAPAPRIHREEP